MFTRITALRVLFAGAAVTAAGALSTGIASADDQQWNVTNLAPSSDRIDYMPVGTLWEATATGTGAGVPFIPGFSARGGGDSYTVLWGVATPRGVNPSGLDAGESVTGKLYFDVTGARPNQVAFGDGNGPEKVWSATPQAPAKPAVVRPNSVPAPMPAQNAVPKAAPAPAAAATPAPAAPAPATGSTGTPISAGTPAAEAPAAATPAPAAATPAPAAPASPAPAAATPAPAAPASATPAAPAPASATPAPASATPAPASTDAPAPTSGSQGTPLTPPTTSAVPVPAS